jgi:hypothetical protein
MPHGGGEWGAHMGGYSASNGDRGGGGDGDCEDRVLISQFSIRRWRLHGPYANRQGGTNDDKDMGSVEGLVKCDWTIAYRSFSTMFRTSKWKRGIRSC